MSTQTISRGENVSEIQALTEEIARRNGQVDFWNTAIIVAMVVAFVAAGALVVTQTIAFRRAKQLADAQSKLLKLKDADLALDLKEKDLKIKEAGERASKADEAAAKARADASHADERAAKLEKDAAEAKLETEKLKQVVAWRVLSPEESAALEKVLSASPGQINLLYTDGDPEALVLAIQFSRVLEKAKWKIVPLSTKLANSVQFGILVPDVAGKDAVTLRAALTEAKIEFFTGPMPPVAVWIGIPQVPGAPTLFIGSRKPPLLP